MSGVAIANLPGIAQTRDFDTESRRLFTILNLAREESIVQAAEFGFKPTDDTYGFYVYDESQQKWMPYTQLPFQERNLPEGISLELSVEGKALALSTDDEEKDIPPILLLSSGEITPFTLTIFNVDDDGSDHMLEKSLSSDGYSDLEWLDDE